MISLIEYLYTIDPCISGQSGYVVTTRLLVGALSSSLLEAYSESQASHQPWAMLVFIPIGVRSSIAAWELGETKGSPRERRR